MNETRQPAIYAYPRLSKADLMFVRIGGNGLGNLMFTWARAVAAAQRNGWQIIWPTWGSVKPSNWRKNPYDHRTYFDLFRPTDAYCYGLSKPLHLARRRWISEADAASGPVPPGTIVQFRGMDGLFEPYRADHALIKRELLAIARPEHCKALSNTRRAPIAIHVRCGDFTARDSQLDTISKANSMLPIDWYIGALEALRSAAGWQVPAQVFSDGTEEQVRPLLDCGAVTRADYGSGLGDMIGLAASSALIASGSTFSMWGSFLGQVPTVWHPGKMLQPLHGEGPDCESEWAIGDAPPPWAAKVLNPDQASPANTGSPAETATASPTKLD